MRSLLIERNFPGLLIHLAKYVTHAQRNITLFVIADSFHILKKTPHAFDGAIGGSESLDYLYRYLNPAGLARTALTLKRIQRGSNQ